jgi:hypothetical protein
VDKRQKRTLWSFQHVLIFLDRYPLAPEPPLFKGMRASLEHSMKRIKQLESDQDDARRAINRGSELRRNQIRRERMMPLVRIAKPLLAFAPGADAALRVPHARADTLTVAAAALRMADALTPHAKLLKAAGYDKDFLKAFRHEARELALVARNSERARHRRSDATAAIAAEFKKAMKTLTVIEGILMAQYARQPGMQAEWRNRRRVSARLGRPPERSKKRRALPEPIRETELPLA